VVRRARAAGRRFSRSINKTTGLLDITGADQIPISAAEVKGCPRALGVGLPLEGIFMLSSGEPRGADSPLAIHYS